MTSAGVVSSARMMSRVCGRTRRILRNSSISSLPEVFSLVRMRSQGVASAKARAAALLGACRMHQARGFSVPVSTASTWGSASTTRAVLTGNGRFSRCGTALIYSNHSSSTSNGFSNLLSEIPGRLRHQHEAAGRPIRDGELRRLSGMFCTNCTGTLPIRAVE